MIQGLRGGEERAPEVTEYLDLLRQQREAGLPPPVDVSEFVTRAEERGRTAREEARRQALGAALLQLGGGLAAGDLAAGIRGAGTQAAEIMGQGRKEAAQQTALAEQLRMRGAESQRQAQVEALGLQREATKAIADVATSERASKAEREQMATKLFSDFVTALENRRSELAQQGRLDARNFATTATNLFENMVAPLTGFETPEQLAQRDQAFERATISAANMLGIDPGPVIRSLRASSPVVVEHQGKRYQFPNQQAADEFKQRMGS